MKVSTFVVAVLALFALTVGNAIACESGECEQYSADWSVTNFAGTRTFGPEGTQVLNATGQQTSLNLNFGELVHVQGMSGGSTLFEGTLGADTPHIDTGSHGSMEGNFSINVSPGTPFCLLGCDE